MDSFNFLMLMSSIYDLLFFVVDFDAICQLQKECKGCEHGDDKEGFGTICRVLPSIFFQPSDGFAR